MTETPTVQVLGHINCQACDFPDVPVRPMKNGRAYCICPECDWQGAARSRAADRAIRTKLRPINQPAPKEAPASEKPSKPPVGKPAPAPRRGALDF